MSARKGLGDLFNLGTSETTSAVRVNLKNATGVTVVVLTATSGNVTVSESNAASGGTTQTVGTTAPGVGITEYFTQNNGVWTRVTGAAPVTITCATGGLLAVYVSAAQLSPGFTYVSASHSSAHIGYVLHGLQSKRDPVNFPDVRA